ncbi:OmpA family protein [Ferriphaselus sp. R-1]|uniref:OmpA family protein n=1 Tax=Ferriphaselus sp. R-1 TaxID=1485544 RepID=UPI0005545396|nr:OmpA family protein [Ferriphaselus sp. R-1]
MLRPLFAFISVVLTLALPAQACDQDVELDRMLPAVAKFNRDETTPYNKEEIGERIRHICHYLGEHPDVVVVVRGYTDARGSSEHKLAIGHIYAEWMKKRMMLQGCDMRKITTMSFGKDKAHESDTEGLAPNRAEILLKRAAPQTDDTATLNDK